MSGGCLEGFKGMGPQCVMGVPWYSVMGVIGDALKVSWDCHLSAFSVSLRALGVSWRCL